MHKDILVESDRKVLCDFLLEHATDDILIRASEDTKDHYQTIKNDLDGLKKFIGVSKFFLGIPTAANTQERKKLEVQEVVPIVEVEEPPGFPAKKVSPKTVGLITRVLQAGPAKEEFINAAINGILTNTRSVLKLLWSRKTLKYIDGKFST